ncbi:MAG: glycosyltransferase [Planctomycetales bacterium]|nr:glycosyltransferase [Planctomycetales bacterium]
MTVTPIRVACCITELEAGGAERMFVELVCRLDRNQWQPTVISLGGESEAFADRLRRADIEVRCLGVTRRWDVSAVGRLAGELKHLAPDVLQTWLFHANVAGCLAARRAGIEPVVTGIRVAEQRGRWRRWVERFCTSRARRHVCVSRDVAEFSRIQGGLDAGKLVVIPNGVDLDRFAGVEPMDLGGWGIAPGVPVVAWIGRLDPQKDPLAAVEAFDTIANSESECRLVMAGDGPLRGRVESRIEGLGLGERVVVLGRISEVPSLMARSVALLLTSRWEGMPNVVLEAMAAARPVVTRPVHGIGDLVEDGQTGLVVPNDQTALLGEALLALLAKRDVAEAMGQRGRKVVAEQYSLETMVSRYEAVWQQEVAVAG